MLLLKTKSNHACYKYVYCNAHHLAMQGTDITFTKIKHNVIFLQGTLLSSAYVVYMYAWCRTPFLSCVYPGINIMLTHKKVDVIYVYTIMQLCIRTHTFPRKSITLLYTQNNKTPKSIVHNSTSHNTPCMQWLFNCVLQFTYVIYSSLHHTGFTCSIICCPLVCIYMLPFVERCIFRGYSRHVLTTITGRYPCM